MDSNPKICYTIGHSNHSIEDFIKLLKKHRIEYLIDIRTIPFSKYSTQFNKNEINGKLAEEGIMYRYLGKMIGGGRIRFNDLNTHPLNLNEIRNEGLFQKGIEIVENFIQKGKRIVLMCSEKDPITCHRFFLVSFILQQDKIAVRHILGDGSLVENQVLENELRKKYAQKRLEDFTSGASNLEDLYNKHAQSIFSKYKGKKK